MEDKHDEIIEEIKVAIIKTNKARIWKNFNYSLYTNGEIYQIDLVVLIDFNLIIFEIKTGIKEKKARKQLEFHKKAFIEAQSKIKPIKNIQFSKIQIFWVTYEDEKIVNLETNEEMKYINFINDPLSFLKH